MTDIAPERRKEIAEEFDELLRDEYTTDEATDLLCAKYEIKPEDVISCVREHHQGQDKDLDIDPDPDGGNGGRAA